MSPPSVVTSPSCLTPINGVISTSYSIPRSSSVIRFTEQTAASSADLMRVELNKLIEQVPEGNAREV